MIKTKPIELSEGMFENLMHQSKKLDELIRDDSIAMTRGRWNTIDQVQQILHYLINQAL